MAEFERANKLYSSIAYPRPTHEINPQRSRARRLLHLEQEYDAQKKKDLEGKKFMETFLPPPKIGAPRIPLRNEVEIKPESVIIIISLFSME